MADYILINEKVPKQRWIEFAQQFRRGRTLPIDTKQFPVASDRLIELQGLLGFMNHLTKNGYRFGTDYFLIEPSSTETPPAASP